ncbi:hypothetical protein IU427_00335 [Nocardia beijingensis]|uniref:hypothetical protein n=1 Tax=Nocardia beijingensis TaxID=95162 RepID=UPI0018938F4C|nr:hypothetical protein [Nocardia beijingensis]MBF6463625.1 hypothetical protein [Nocardia beijingensis]
MTAVEPFLGQTRTHYRGRRIHSVPRAGADAHGVAAVGPRFVQRNPGDRIGRAGGVAGVQPTESCRGGRSSEQQGGATGAVGKVGDVALGRRVGVARDEQCVLHHAGGEKRVGGRDGVQQTGGAVHQVEGEDRGTPGRIGQPETDPLLQERGHRRLGDIAVPEDARVDQHPDLVEADLRALDAGPRCPRG